jgi:hypothetical protein
MYKSKFRRMLAQMSTTVLVRQLFQAACTRSVIVLIQTTQNQDLISDSHTITN